MYVAVSPICSVLSVGSQGSSVRQLQRNLNARFQNFGVTALISVLVDGVFGSETLIAVKYLQCVGGLPVNGRVDEATWCFIEYGVEGLPALTIGRRCTYVTAVQKTVLDSGIAIKADGYFGEKTAQAVTTYQQRMGLTVSGSVGFETWQQIVRSRLTELPCVALLPNPYRP